MSDRHGEQAELALRRRLATAMLPVREQDATITSRLEALCTLLTGEIDIIGCSVTLVVSDQVHATAARSPAGIAAIDTVSFDTGEGPTFDAFTSRKPVLVAELLSYVGRWPGYVSELSAQGVMGVHAFPLQFGVGRCGVLTCYRGTAGQLSPAALATCAVYADVMTQALLRHGDGPVGPDEIDELSTGAQIRTEVYQAQGMIRSTLGVSLTEALARLRAAAFAAGLPLNEVAADIVAGRRPSDLRDRAVDPTDHPPAAPDREDPPPELDGPDNL